MPTETTDTESDDEEFGFATVQGANAEGRSRSNSILERVWFLEERGAEDSSDEDKEVEYDAKQHPRKEQPDELRQSRFLQRRDAQRSAKRNGDGMPWPSLGVVLFIGGLGAIALDTRLANSGKPPHPGPEQMEQSFPEDKPRERFILTHEQQALIATNRQIANHRKAMKAAQKDKPQEVQTEARVLTDKRKTQNREEQGQSNSKSHESRAEKASTGGH